MPVRPQHRLPTTPPNQCPHCVAEQPMRNWARLNRSHKMALSTPQVGDPARPHNKGAAEPYPFFYNNGAGRTQNQGNVRCHQTPNTQQSLHEHVQAHQGHRCCWQCMNRPQTHPLCISWTRLCLLYFRIIILDTGSTLPSPQGTAHATHAQSTYMDSHLCPTPPFAAVSLLQPLRQSERHARHPLPHAPGGNSAATPS